VHNVFGWRLLVAIAILGGAVFMAVTRDPNLGLDLRGGTQIVLEAQQGPDRPVDERGMDRTLESLRRRVDALGVAEPSLQRSGDRRIIVELPGVTDPTQAREVIGRTAQLAFHPVLGTAAAPATAPGATTTTAPRGEGVLTDEQGQPIRVGPAALDGDLVGDARAAVDPRTGRWHVEVDFRGDGGARWARLTGEAACAPAGDPRRRVAIALDGAVVTSPQVERDVGCGVGITGGTTTITGDFGQGEAKDLALLIRSGALPLPVRAISQTTIGATLGEAAVAASVRAAVVGAALTILYMLLYYRMLGGLTALSLLAYGTISFAVLLALRSTLTLPGIAGFVLAIGMAIDANVLVYERAKEEFAAGARLRPAVGRGFAKALSAIVDANVSTLIAAALLFFLASGAVRGFAVTVGVGVITSLFTTLVITRTLVAAALRSRAVVARPGLLGMGVGERLRRWIAERRPDLFRRGRLWLALSAAVVVIALGGLVVRGLNVGVEFTGGRLLEYDTAADLGADQVLARLAEAGLPAAVVQLTESGNVTVRTSALDDAGEAKVREAVAAAGGAATGTVTKVRDEFVGPTIGDELRRKAQLALGIGLSLQLAYIALRFRLTYGLGAVAGMVQSVVILLGVFAWTGRRVDGVFVAALLTVIGYSLNDAVVVFDRIRERVGERTGARARAPLAALANEAVLQTIPRTINTGLGALFILTALLVLGGETITDFALALLVGILAGTLSSVFTSAQLAVVLERRAGADARARPIRPGVPPGGKPPVRTPRATPPRGTPPGGTRPAASPVRRRR
jgi:SecD/SecF fusion protein